MNVSIVGTGLYVGKQKDNKIPAQFNVSPSLRNRVHGWVLVMVGKNVGIDYKT